MLCTQHIDRSFPCVAVMEQDTRPRLYLPPRPIAAGDPGNSLCIMFGYAARIVLVNASVSWLPDRSPAVRLVDQVRRRALSRSR